VYLDLSFNPLPDINNALMLKVGNCAQLEALILTGCSTISDEAISNLINGEKAKGKSEGLSNLKILKVGGLVNLSDSVNNLVKRCLVLELFEANNLEKLTDAFLDHIKLHPTLNRLLINFTPNITEAKIAEVREANKNLRIIRNIVKMTDPADDGLRMPLPPASLKKKKPKKKKK
jgi:F-box/leucine-rich repeat protein 2/20